jgi:hypothetical protein
MWTEEEVLPDHEVREEITEKQPFWGPSKENENFGTMMSENGW